MDLKTTAGLADACARVVAAKKANADYQDWVHRLAGHLESIRLADHNEFLTTEFQKMLWDSEAVSATGMGQVPTSDLWSDRDTLESLWRIRSLAVDGDTGDLTQSLVDAWDALAAHIRGMGQRLPRLKLARVFAALRPEAFTTLASRQALVRIARAMGVGNSGDHRVVLNRRIMDRLDAAVGDDAGLDTDEAWPQLRMKLPWLLYEELSKIPEKGEPVRAGDQPGLIELQPLPANRRRRGLLAIAGYFDSILAMLQFVKDGEDGCSRTDFSAHIHSLNPNLGFGSVATNINALMAEWDAIRADGDRITLTERGQALLESGDPDEASDWLLTQILGFDNALHVLREGPLQKTELMSFMQTVNPGWTSNFIPSSMVKWLCDLDLVEFEPGAKRMMLTARGRQWAEQIVWTPQVLAPVAPVTQAKEVSKSASYSRATRPAVDDIVATFPSDLVFPKSLVARLDAALWSHPRRHFAVLTGLSGTGKTQLAMRYAKALWRGEKEAAGDDGLCVVPVQPGWYDPSALLGYMSPLIEGSYVKTDFLNFLLNAVRDPDRPYTVILDEMNLSHPEQYLAPLLSAMETGAGIALHAEGDEVDEVPPTVPYPENLVLIGTINMDETTVGLSDKVLDRASVIEFWEIDVAAWPGWADCGLADDQRGMLRDLLDGLMHALMPVRLHFGWRTISDITGYVEAALQGGVIQFTEAIDDAMYGKILPKLRGEDSQPLRQALEQAHELLDKYGLKRSVAKLQQLRDELEGTGIARFWR